jgi:DNA uptake protein ComE-like DNA-binding protein
MRKSFRQYIISYFTFLRNDRVGVITLIILITMAIICHVIISQMNFIPATDFTEAKKALENWKNQKVLIENHTLFKFDPNTISVTQLDCLDVPLIIKRNLLKYREAGGRFFAPADLRKIYGMNDSLYASLEPFIIVDYNPSIASGKERNHDVKKGMPELAKSQNAAHDLENAVADDSPFFKGNPFKNKNLIIELNSADSSDLTMLYGIGPVYASRIIKYRNLLGGFYSTTQLREVYGLKEETLKLIHDFVTVDTSYIRSLRVNFDDYKELIRHPYLEKQHVEAILNYRSQNGPFTSISQILQFGLLDSSAYTGIKPYLTCR